MTRNPATRALAFSGVALAVGMGIYAFSRPAGSAYLLPAALQVESPSLALPAVLGGSLPAFLHVYALALLTVVVLGVTRARAAWAAAAWCAIDLVFEFAQWQPLAERLAANLPTWFGQVPVLDHLGAFLIRGSFDQSDIAATLIGAVTAYLTVLLMLHEGDNHVHEYEN